MKFSYFPSKKKKKKGKQAQYNTRDKDELQFWKDKYGKATQANSSRKRMRRKRNKAREKDEVKQLCQPTTQPMRKGGKAHSWWEFEGMVL